MKCPYGITPETAPMAKPEEPHGPGTELKKLLKLVGIEAAPNCACNAHASEMDAKGPDWCEQNMHTILEWLREEASKRWLPFAELVARSLVQRAIKNARKHAL